LTRPLPQGARTPAAIETFSWRGSDLEASRLGCSAAAGSFLGLPPVAALDSYSRSALPARKSAWLGLGI